MHCQHCIHIRLLHIYLLAVELVLPNLHGGANKHQVLIRVPLREPLHNRPAILSAGTVCMAGCNSLALAQQFGAEQVEVEVGRVVAEPGFRQLLGISCNSRLLNLSCNALHATERERGAHDNPDHLPAHGLDEDEREAQEVERDALLEVDTEDIRERGLDTGFVSFTLWLVAHILSIDPSWSIIACTIPCMALKPC